MKFFKSDLFRSLAIGFLIGTAIVGLKAAPDALAISAPAADVALAQVAGR